ncbi:unnamed protein product [Didymodactylos carnosus]|uniref:Amidase domain-containing protein n=1 Tax=Didymodactylos carnosus TaxID=1234261 RepID=A0A8S2DGA0_9BILA|nr:unnamed protein product [Didymodactylos carnosus]CAF3671669.1 unnamed protein product [Didymodactylos carnosus]
MAEANLLKQFIISYKIKSYQVCSVYIERIKAIQPFLNVYIDERFEQALVEAYEIDRILDSGKFLEQYSVEKAPFLGVPFAIKESMQFKGFHNSTGILARKNFICDRTAPVVENLIKAGGILLCNTNVSEACMWFESRNYLYGTTNNPYDLTRIVGGSSGGCGCIVSAAGVPFAIGSDIGGSIRLPSFMNGIFGHKTTPDIVPNDCQYPPHKDFHQKYLLATGPMCRYASDLHPMLKALGQEHISQKLPNFNTPVDLSKLRYFYIDDIDAYFVNKISKEQKQAHRRVVDHFERKYNVHVTRLRLTRLRYAVSLWSSMMVDGQLQTRDFGLTLNNRQDYINGYHELLKKFLFRSTHTLPAIGLAILECIPNRYNQRFHIMAHKFYEEIQSMLQDNGVLFFPSFPHSAPEHCWPLLLNTFDYIYCGIINALGLPSTQCPLGLDSKQLPLGIQVVAGRYQDHLTIACAQEIENAIGGWIPPSPVAYI